MASTSKPPRPRRLQALHGLPEARRPGPPSAGEVAPPADLSGAALAVWHRLAPDLIAKGVLDPWSVDAFARLCWCQATSVELRSAIDAEGWLVPGARSGETVRNKLWMPLRQTNAELTQLESRFGLTPADRGRVDPVDRPSDAARYLNAERLLT